MKRHLLALATAALLFSPLTSRAADVSIAGIPNFRKVDDRIFRGGQPDRASWSELSKLGVTTVVDLRRGVEHSIDAESKAVTEAGMKYVNFPMNGFDTPTAGGIAKVLATLDGPGKVFVHCKQGRDRTGTVIAAYRVSRDHWSNARALDEARAMGLHWFEGGMKRFIAGYRPDAPALVAASPAAVGSDSLRVKAAAVAE